MVVTLFTNTLAFKMSLRQEDNIFYTYNFDFEQNLFSLPYQLKKYCVVFHWIFKIV